MDHNNIFQKIIILKTNQICSFTQWQLRASKHDTKDSGDRNGF